LQVLTVFRYS